MKYPALGQQTEGVSDLFFFYYFSFHLQKNKIKIGAQFPEHAEKNGKPEGHIIEAALYSLTIRPHSGGGK